MYSSKRLLIPASLKLGMATCLSFSQWDSSFLIVWNTDLMAGTPATIWNMRRSSQKQKVPKSLDRESNFYLKSLLMLSHFCLMQLNLKQMDTVSLFMLFMFFLKDLSAAHFLFLTPPLVASTNNFGTPFSCGLLLWLHRYFSQMPLPFLDTWLGFLLTYQLFAFPFSTWRIWCKGI